MEAFSRCPQQRRAHPPSIQAPQKLEAAPPQRAAGALRRTLQAAQRAWDVAAYGLNCEWLALPRWPSMALLALLVVGLSLAVGLTASSVKDSVTLGVEFGGGYSMM